MLLLQRLHLIALIYTLLQTLTKSAQYCPLKLYLRLTFKCSYASWVSPFAIFCLDLQIGTNFGNGTLKIFLTSVKNVLPPFIDMFQTGSVSQVCKSGHTVILNEHWQGCYYKNSFFYFTMQDTVINNFLFISLFKEINGNTCAKQLRNTWGKEWWFKQYLHWKMQKNH